MSGLDDLVREREKASKPHRSMPAPKRPPRATPVTLPSVSTADTSPHSAQPEAPAQPPATPNPQPAPAAATDDLTPNTIYLDPAADNLITDVIAAGRKARPKIAVSRSAVVRFALAELARRMDAASVVSELAAGAKSAGTGRRRL